jgi:hypothetical protein
MSKTTLDVLREANRVVNQGLYTAYFMLGCFAGGFLMTALLTVSGCENRAPETAPCHCPKCEAQCCEVGK